MDAELLKMNLLHVLFRLTIDMGKRLCSDKLRNNIFYIVLLCLTFSHAYYETLTTDNEIQHGCFSSLLHMTAMYSYSQGVQKKLFFQIWSLDHYNQATRLRIIVELLSRQI